jgi:uncharacterized membrane protein YqaE (UPF0057 family)
VAQVDAIKNVPRVILVHIRIIVAHFIDPVGVILTQTGNLHPQLILLLSLCTVFSDIANGGMIFPSKE